MSDGQSNYSVAADEVAQNEFGNKSDLTWGEAYDAGKLQIQDDDIDGNSHGAHGTIYVSS